MPNPKLQRTKDYSRFVFAKGNRDVSINRLRPAHKALRESMKKYGWLPFEPIGVYPDGKGKLVITEGQHRFTFARELGLDVYYVIHEEQVDIAEINQCAATWTPSDYCKKWIHDGNSEYEEVIEIAEYHGIPITIAFSMLAGSASWQQAIKKRFESGAYKITNRKNAMRVFSIYKALCDINKSAKHSQMLRSIWACCLVPHFEETRLINTAKRRPEMLTRVGTLDAWLEIIQDIYNFGRSAKVPIKFEAQEAARNNTSVQKKKARAA